MTIERVCANSPSMSRQQPAGNLARPCEAPGTGAFEKETPVMQLFREHQSMRDWINKIPSGANDETMDFLTDQLRALEERMMEIPSETPGDVAAKAIAHFGDDGPDTPYHHGTFWKEVRQLAT